MSLGYFDDNGNVIFCFIQEVKSQLLVLLIDNGATNLHNTDTMAFIREGYNINLSF
ncbi:hypothetical protein D3C73_699070 [compost metagenome]